MLLYQAGHLISAQSVFWKIEPVDLSTRSPQDFNLNKGLLTADDDQTGLLI